MRSNVVAAGALCLLLLGAGTAAAQEPGKAGITMGYPASIGVLWHVSDRVALRPEISFSSGGSSAEDDSSSTDTWSAGTGLSVLFYTTKSDSLRTYVAPRFTYARSEFSGDFSDQTNTSSSFAGLFGAQYALSPRFSVFGEVGAGYSSQKNSSSGSLAGTFVSKSHSFSTRTGVGVVLYF